MGGYGAVRNGLKYRKNFGGIAGLSVADLMHAPEIAYEAFGKAYMESIFGDLEKAENTDKSLNHLIRTSQGRINGSQRIYIGCGKSDPLLKTNRELKDQFRSNGYDVTYSETSGGHEWDFWNSQIKEVLDWIVSEDQADN